MRLAKIPKFEDETGEANWAYEHREELAAAYLQAAQEGRVRQSTLNRSGSTIHVPFPVSCKVARRGEPLEGSGFGVQQLWNRYNAASRLHPPHNNRHPERQ